MCGHEGTFSFSSPEYAVKENGGTIRITVRRSGGGVSDTTVDYDLQHLSTNDTFVTPTHVYTTTQTLSFKAGEISKSFLVTIHDDRVYHSPNRRFLLVLRNPTNGASLGPQHRTIVTIVDDDEARTVAANSYAVKDRDYTAFVPTTTVENGIHFENDVSETRVNTKSFHRAFAGVDNIFAIHAIKGNEVAQTTGGDTFLIEVVEKKHRAGYRCVFCGKSCCCRRALPGAFLLVVSSSSLSSLLHFVVFLAL